MIKEKIAPSARKIMNWNDVPQEFIDDPGFESKMQTLRLGEAAGSQRLYVNIDQVKPGAKSVKYHSHSRQEEFFLILDGEGALRMNDEEFPVKRGDFVSKPAGQGIAHQFINTGNRALKILDCGLMEPDDIVTYPDEDVVLLRKEKLTFKKEDAIKNWSSDPNDSK